MTSLNKKTKIFVIGSSGQLGKAFVRELSLRKYNFEAADKNNLDITQFTKMSEMIESVGPDIVLNCAAYNLVDTAESNVELADLINNKAVKYLSDICNNINSILVHYSTDYVFDGTKNEFYTEDDKPNPVNVYGKTKFMGEEAVLNSACKALVLRSSWVYGDGNQNFVYKLINWSKSSRHIKISCDEVSIPTSVDEIVKVTLMLIDKNVTGLFHLTNSNYCSRYELSRFVIETLKRDNIIIPVPMSNFNNKADRPKFSAMSNSKITKITNYKIPHWKESLKQNIISLYS